MIKNVKIEKQDNFGTGIAHVDNKTIFVDFALPGDIVDIDIYLEKKNYSRARVVNYINTSIIKAVCPYYYLCGGCNLMHQLYSEQLKFKYEKVKESLSFLDNVKVNDIISIDKLGYRNKITLHIKNNKLGLFKNKSNDVVCVDKCLLVNDRINKVIDEINKYLLDNKTSDNEVIIRSGEEVIVSFKNEIKDIEKYLSAENIVVRDKVIKGCDYIIKEIDGIKYKVNYNSFFQVNDYVVPLLYNEIIKNVDSTFDNVLDLYSGVGSITLKLAKYAKSVTGIEIIKDAVIDANYNKELNNIDNVNFIYGKVEDNIDSLENSDLIVVDPPRSGLDNKTIDNIIRINPKKLIYTSCSLETLRRDLKVLSNSYKVISVTPVDMFLNTYHCETICVLERK